MKNWKSLLMAFMAVTFGLAFAATALAQGPGTGMGMRNYNPQTEVAVKGTVEEVQQVQGRNAWMGTHLVLKTDSGTMDVHVGPSDFVTKNNFSFAKGDAIEVLGSKVMIQDKDALLAREIVKDGKTLVLRNAQGIPEWSGGQRRNN